MQVDAERVCQEVRVQDALEVAAAQVEAEVAQLGARQVDRDAVQFLEREVGRRATVRDARLLDAQDRLVQVGLRRRERARHGEDACGGEGRRHQPLYDPWR